MPPSSAFFWLVVVALLHCCCLSAAQPMHEPGKVIVLTDDNFDNYTATGKWMVNLFSPRCRHCRTLEPIWELLAREAADENLGFYVAKADMVTSPILRHRFMVTGVPAVYLLEKREAWQYEGKRSVEEFRDFATKGYRETPSLSPVKAPNSAFGRGYGAAVYFCYRVPVVLHEVYTYLREERQLSDLGIFAGLLSIVVMCGLGIICTLDAYYTRRSLTHPHAD